EVGQRDRSEELDHPLVQVGPQVVGRARAVAVVAVVLAAALRGVERRVERDDRVGAGYGLAGSREREPSSGPARALDQFVPAQLAGQLLEIRQRNLLALADAGKRHRRLMLAQGQVDHGGHGEPPLGRQSHSGAVERVKYLSQKLNYTRI